jgi:hypothetical protein
MVAQTDTMHAASQKNDVLRDFMSVTRSHQFNLRIDINQLEVFVGCIAKSNDEIVVKFLPEANFAISNLRVCLSSLEADLHMFELASRALTMSRLTSLERRHFKRK